MKVGCGIALALALAACAGPGETPAPTPAPVAAVELPAGFVSAMADANGTRLHYVRGGRGPAVVLVHGFPQDWSAWRRVMPMLADRYTVVALDLRGIGRSAAASGGFDAATLAEDIHQLARQLQLPRFYVVGHDVGGMAAYALARLHPQAVRGAMLVEAPLPGLAGWSRLKADPALWHIDFQQTPRMPELLIAGRRTVYFREQFFNRAGAVRNDAVSDADVVRYATAYGSLRQLQAGLGIYRALPSNEAFNAARREALAVPLALVGGRQSPIAALLPALAADLKARGAAQVSVDVVADGGHYLADEAPLELAVRIERHAAAAGR